MRLGGLEVQWPQTKNEDLSKGAVVRLGSIRQLDRFGVVKFELPLISHHSARATEDAQRPALNLVVKDHGVSGLHFLVATLPFTGVVQAAICTPFVVVPVLLARLRVVEDEHIRRLGRRAYPTLMLAPKSTMEIRATDLLIGIQIPHLANRMLRTHSSKALASVNAPSPHPRTPAADRAADRGGVRLL